MKENNAKNPRKFLSSLLVVSMLIPAAVPAPIAAQTEKAGDLTVASFNIAAKGSKTTQIGELMASEQVDLAGFQEVDYLNGRNNKDMLSEIAQAAGEETDHYFSKAIDYSGGAYGIGMISRTELTNTSTHSLNTGSYEGRVWQRTETVIDGKTVAFYNTHLTWEDQSLRQQQMDELIRVLDEDTTTYKVLTGDFNAQDSTEEWNRFLENYTMVNGNPDWLDTYIPEDATMSTNAIDNIITTRNLKLKSVKAVEADEIGSDHRALIASFDFLDKEEPSTLLLDKMLEKADRMLASSSKYTEESVTALHNAADAGRNADRTSQSAVLEASHAIEAAIENLKSRPAELVAWYDFEGENPLQDKTGRGNDGKAAGTVTYQTSVSDLGQALDTSNGYVSVAKSGDDLHLKTGDMSITFWYKATNPGTWSAVLGDKDWNSGGNPGFVVVQGQGQFYNSFAANGQTRQENIVSGTGAKVYDGNWHLITMILDRDDSSVLYVDNEKIASCSIASTAGVEVTTPYPINIGADGTGNYRISSLIDDVKVYRTVLGEDQIQAEYDAHKDRSQAALDNLEKEVRNTLADLMVDPSTEKTMPEFTSEDGAYTAKLYCSENDVLIGDTGSLNRKPLVDTQAQVSYLIMKTGEEPDADNGLMIDDVWITVKGSQKQNETDNAEPKTVPSLQEWKGAEGSFTLADSSRIVVNKADWDLIHKAAEITSEDIHDLFGLTVPVLKGTEADVKGHDVFMTSENSDETLGEQGYRIESGSSLIIRASQYRGALYGTRSMLQGMLASSDHSFAAGTAVDYPNYPIREFMLDIGRKYFPMWYLEDLMKYASWFKLTDFQAHLSEDTFNDYSAFRLESDIPHLTSTDGYYTKEEYREFQKLAADYGVRVITEIDGPAHSRRFIELSKYDDVPDKYKNIALNDTQLNLSESGGARERVFNLMDDILEEYLGGDDPVIITDAFNIGMDEYSGSADDLRAYAIHMYDKIVNTYHKTAFGWDSNGSLPNETYPAESYPIDDVIINFWKWEEVNGGMKALMDAGYKVVNGDHRWYIVPGAQIGFYDYANEEKLFNEVSAGSMIGWYNGGTKFPEGHPNIVGGNMLLWNDRGMFAGYTVNDIFARQQSQYPVLSQAYWSGKQNRNETYQSFKERLEALKKAPSMDNLVKDIKSETDLIYSFDMSKSDSGNLKDLSGNGYDAKITNGSITDGEDPKLQLNGDGYISGAHAALEWPASVAIDVRIDEEQTGDIVLFEEIMPEQECVKKDGVLTGQEKAQIVLKETADGTYQLTYSREGFTFEHQAFLEKGKDYRIVMATDKSTITGGEYSKWNQPNKLYVNGTLVSTLQGPAKPEDFSGTWWVDSPSLNIPLKKIGQKLHGTLDNFRLYNRVLSEEEVKELGSAQESGPVTPDIPDEPVDLALNKPVTASSYKNDTLRPENTVDGDGTTRWASNYSSSVNEPFEKEEWLQIDLEKSVSLDSIRLTWETAYAKRYTVQVSEDGKTFTDVVDITDGKGNTETLGLNGAQGRYLRLAFHEAVPSEDSWAWNYGYSLYSVEVFEAPEIDETINQALNKKVTASSFKNDSLKPENTVDGDGTTRWASNYSSGVNEPFEKEEWLQIDLEKSMPLGEVKLAWENAYAKRYTIQLSEDGETFRDVLEVTDGKGGTETLNLNGETGRYIRFAFHEAVPSEDSWAWNYGYSLFEAEVHARRKAPVQTVDKTLLTSAVAYAEALDRDGVNEIVLNALDRALEQAHSVLENAAASQEEVDEAWRALVEVIHMMDFTSDKSALAALVAECDALDLNGYEDGAEKEAFITALAHAHEVLEDPTALDEVSISEAWNTLTFARSALIPVTEEIDLSILQFLYDSVKDIDLSLYLEDGKEAFRQALGQTAAVLAKAENQQQVDEAATALNQAYMNLRLLPDEALLARLEQFAAAVLSLDRTLFSTEELSRLDEAAEKVQIMVAAHRNGSHQMDQAEAQNLADETDELMALISSRLPENPETKDPEPAPDIPSITLDKPQDSSINSEKPAAETKMPETTSKSVKTAASSGLFSTLAGLGLATGLMPLLRRRKQH